MPGGTNFTSNPHSPTQPMLPTIPIPDTIPLLTIRETVLFPKALLPMVVVDEKEKQLLADILRSSRMVAVTGMNRDPGPGNNHEDYFRTGGVGLVRACHENQDGTSNLILQGLARIEIEKILFEDPYKVARIRILEPRLENPAPLIENLTDRLNRAIQLSVDLGNPIPQHILEFLQNIKEPEAFLDISAFTLCKSVEDKQQLLETLDTKERFELLLEFMRIENDRLQLLSKLKGNLSDEDIELN
jgi:ATP-dependent Lon protease